MCTICEYRLKGRSFYPHCQYAGSAFAVDDFTRKQHPLLYSTQGRAGASTPAIPPPLLAPYTRTCWRIHPGDPSTSTSSPIALLLEDKHRTTVDCESFCVLSFAPDLPRPLVAEETPTCCWSYPISGSIINVWSQHWL